MEHKRIPSEFDECDYQVVKEIPGQSETIFGYAYEDCIKADVHCMRLNEDLQSAGIPESELYYSLEMGPNVPGPS